MTKHTTKLAGLLALGAASLWAQDPIQQKLIGVWKLVSCERRSPSGETSSPLGKDPVGRITYDTAGNMSAQLMRRDPPKFATGSRATAEQMAAAWRGYVGYFGTYTVDSTKSVVIHHVEGAWHPNFVGTHQVRHYRFDRDHLTLEADDPTLGRTTIVWIRSR